MNPIVNSNVTDLMVSAMIDECIFENVNLNFKNENCNRKKESKRRKRIRDAYNEIERGEKNNDE